MWLSGWCFKRALVIGVGMISSGCILADISMRQLCQASCATLVILLVLDCATVTVRIQDKDDDSWTKPNIYDTWPGSTYQDHYQDND